MKLSASRRAKLIVFKILEFAEIGGMCPEDCGVAYEAISNCLDEIRVEEGGETAMAGLIKQIEQILSADEWEQ